MAFLDNSGDIILDAVLTDAGRQRMARGEFRIDKFAFSDEEINYGLFNADHPSGSDFYDLEIMQTPVLEAFTNNTSLMKTKLISINRNNILYMPTFKLNTNLQDSKQHAIGGTYVVLADTSTEPTSTPGSLNDGVLHGVFASALDVNKHHIAIDQGLDTSGDPPRTSPMPADLVETAYLIRMDHRLVRLSGFNGTTYESMSHSFVDDDSISSYYVASTDAAVLGTGNRITRLRNSDTESVAQAEEVFNGPIGPRLRISLTTSESIQQSTSLFDELGTSGTSTLEINEDSSDDLTSGNYKFIDTVINIVGISSGYSMDIPVRIVKKTS
jgi:hypothetical protein